MLLSESEAFWLAILNDELTSRDEFREPRKIPLRLTPSAPVDGQSSGVGESPEVTTQSEGGVQGLSGNRKPTEALWDPVANLQARGERVYESIQEHATKFGVGRKAELRYVAEAVEGQLPPDVVWSTRTGRVLSADELEELRHEIPEHVAEARRHLTAGIDSDARLASFEAGLDLVLSLVACGYAVSSPRCVYGLSESGAPQVTRQIIPRERGLYLSLLQLVCSSVPLPAVERMAMAAAGYRDDDALRAWVPSLGALSKPVGEFVPEKAKATFKDFQSSNCESEGWQLGERLSQLLRSSMNFSDGAESAANDIDRWEDEDIELDEFTSGEGTYRGVDYDDTDTDGYYSDGLGTEEVPDDYTESSEDSSAPTELTWKTPCSPTASMLELWLGIVKGEDQDRSAALEPYAEEIRDAADNHDQIIRAFVAEAEGVATRCRAHRLPGVSEMIKAAIDVVPQINPMRSGAVTSASAAYRQLAEAFSKSSQFISDAMKVAYGELRLRELKWDDHGLPAAALAGWTRQNENIRAAIKVAIEQLNNGLPPYVALTQLAPASEALVRQMAAQHLPGFKGVNAGKLLHELRQTIGLGPDEHEVRAALSTAQALVSLRNWAVHESDVEWGRDHAAFFLNGLSILLRRL